MKTCTCCAPESVDLSAWFPTPASRNAGGSRTHDDDAAASPTNESAFTTFTRSEETATANSMKAAAIQMDPLQHRLYRNLSTFGWSPVSIRASLLRESLTSKCGGDADFWRPRIMELFQDDAISGLGSDADAPAEDAASPVSSARSFRGGALTYRTSESGSPEIVEPKSSWEYKPSIGARTSFNPPRDGEACEDARLERVEGRLEAWSHLCMDVALAVCRMLDLPPILLSPSATPHEPAAGHPQRFSVDLLRAFCYDVVSDPRETQHDSQPTATMGSSPHTDWGSFTVVWQDRVGGLQTFCRACQAWKDVPSSSGAPGGAAEGRGDAAPDMIVEFVVHVGDMTSLAIRQARLMASSSPDSKAKRAENNDAACIESEPIVSPFPSPLHRVLSPTAEKRVSLVYFAYPSPEATLDDLVHAALEWRLLPVVPTQGPVDRVADRDVPFEEYFLLRDQHKNQHAENVRQSGADRFRELLHVPVRAALEEKWNQVQRPY